MNTTHPKLDRAEVCVLVLFIVFATGCAFVAGAAVPFTHLTPPTTPHVLFPVLALSTKKKNAHIAYILTPTPPDLV